MWGSLGLDSMRIGVTNHNLTAAMLHRDRYGPSLAASAHALRVRSATRASAAERSGLVGPVVEQLAMGAAWDRVVPAEWPYANPTAAPRVDEPYEAHRIPNASKGESAAKLDALNADVTSMFVDLYV